MRIRTRTVIAVLIGFGFIGLLLVLLFKPIPEKNEDVIKVLVGFLGGAFVTMISFYFGDAEGKGG